MPSATRFNPYFTFLSVAIAVSVIASIIAHSPRPYPLVAAASLDLIVTIPAAWYLLLVRPRLRPKTTLIFVALAGLWRASVLFPRMLPGNAVPGKIWIGGALELAFIAAVVVGLRKSRGTESFTGDDLDPLDRLRDILARFTPSRAAAKIMASEFSVLYYAFAWKPKPHIPSGARGFSIHERSGTNVLFVCVAFLALLEIVPVHLMLNTWSPVGAWIETGLSAWGAIAIMAMSRAFALRPMLVSSDGIVVRYGLLFRLRIPVDHIQSIETGADCPAGTRVVPRSTPASVCIRFSVPLEAEFLLGITKRVSAIGLSADDVAGFTGALNQLTRRLVREL
jgi:hypothetical protein